MVHEPAGLTEPSARELHPVLSRPTAESARGEECPSAERAQRIVPVDEFPRHQPPRLGSPVSFPEQLHVRGARNPESSVEPSQAPLPPW